jgi:hypothetical protein
MDTFGIMYVRPSVGGRSLQDFASQIFRWLDISSFKEEWVGKGDVQVFVGSAVGITVGISETHFKSRVEPYKLPKLEKYPFVISLSPQGTNQAADYLVQHAHVLAWRLSHEGFRCFVPKDGLTAQSDEDGMVYDAKHSAGANTGKLKVASDR